MSTWTALVNLEKETHKHGEEMWKWISKPLAGEASLWPHEIVTPLPVTVAQYLRAVSSRPFKQSYKMHWGRTQSVITNETERDALYFLYKLISALRSFTLVTARVISRLWTMHFCAPFLHWNLNRLKVTMFFKIIRSNGKGWFEHRLQKRSAEVKPYLSSSMLVTFLEGKMRRI